jgi:hypothetical protein
MLAGMNIGAAIVIGAALVAGAMAISHRYAISAHRVACNDEHSACSGVWRLDQWSGEMWFCQHANFGLCMTIRHENQKTSP